MLNNARNIIYRGSLKSCNYSCSYCTFSKIKIDLKNIENDRIYLFKFLEKIKQYNFKQPINFMITPYGEAMIYEHYQDTLINLCNEKFINKVGCQTNLSFNIDKFINKLKNINSKKIVLWATYHFEMENINNFVNKVKKLSKFINITVGVVGNPKNIEQIKILRNSLPQNIYLWINKMDGLNRKYTLEEIKFFNNIDPMFKWEVKTKKEPFCTASKEDFFVNFKGDLILCHKNKSKIGNIYTNKMENYIFNCKGVNCNCYLTYSNLYEFKKEMFFKDNELFRLPKKLKLDAIFLDIDGTIYNNKNKIDKQTFETIQYISTKTKIYLATELPFYLAMKKCKNIKHLISGGVFSSGTHYIDFDKNIENFLYINETIILKNSKNITLYENNNKIHKIILAKNNNINFNDLYDNIDIIDYKNSKIAIIPKGVNKFTSIQEICKINNFNLKNIMCVGNDENDLSMLKNCGYSVCIPNSKISSISSFDYYLNINQLNYII